MKLSMCRKAAFPFRSPWSRHRLNCTESITFLLPCWTLSHEWLTKSNPETSGFRISTFVAEIQVTPWKFWTRPERDSRNIDGHESCVVNTWCTGKALGRVQWSVSVLWKFPNSQHSRRQRVVIVTCCWDSNSIDAGFERRPLNNSLDNIQYLMAHLWKPLSIGQA